MYFSLIIIIDYSPVEGSGFDTTWSPNFIGLIMSGVKILPSHGAVETPDISEKAGWVESLLCE